MKVTTRGRTWVGPTAPTKEHWLPLNNLDRMMYPTFVGFTFYYKHILKNVSYDVVLRNLKNSLRETLVHFYPLAGRLKVSEDGLVNLHCNDAGIPFFEAVSNEELISTNGSGKVEEDGTGHVNRPMPELSGLDAARLGPGPFYLPDQLTPIPVLIIQLTRFRCQSIALAVNWHQSVADGHSGSHFIKTWSEIAQGKPISLKPVHCRDLIKSTDQLDPTIVQQLVGYSFENSVHVLGAAAFQGPPIVQEPIMLKVIQIHKETLLGLKRNDCCRLMRSETVVGMPKTVEAQGCNSIRQVTSNPLERSENSNVLLGSQSEEELWVSAYLWKMMASAQTSTTGDDVQAVNSAGNAKIRFVTSIDGRDKLNLPKGYFGNAVLSACAVSSEADIRNQSLAETAELIRNVTRSISEEHFRFLIDWVRRVGFAAPSPYVQQSPVGKNVSGTFWNCFPPSEVDFGWGKPSLAVRGSPPSQLIDSFSIIPSTKDSAHVTALLSIRADRMRTLECDPMFTQHFSSNE